ncbi:hypothetical protein LRP30_30305 [Bradyrhizobium sp. C-145]|uniref:hypothetical protein n=1 Tax=Bradyrhizobium sp. C-145 TaxID=574727 RepID=UPI00201B8C57|nr:hypothetical protein [Bradyrhizobium sp. C-145]UQR61228.1 hypothetical protein LRP30_30305 [Bradyrhizobium sp. C-145]
MDTLIVALPMARHPGRRADQRLETVQANAKLTIDHAIATLEQNHRQIRATIQKDCDASARAKLETGLNLIEQDLKLAKLKSLESDSKCLQTRKSPLG